jgi:hypothetical protein
MYEESMGKLYIPFKNVELPQLETEKELSKLQLKT